jgi:methionyl-tRNA formyltransferase
LNRLNQKNDVSHVLKEHNVQIIRLKKNINNQDSLSTIRSYNPDLLISIAGNQIFKKELIDLAPKGCLNLHTALLPKYRGIMPSFWVLRNNEKETGVSVFFVDEGIDSGEIIVQKHLQIDDKMTQQQLIKVSKQMGMDAIIEAITKIQTGGYSLIHNDDENKTY